MADQGTRSPLRSRDPAGIAAGDGQSRVVVGVDDTPAGIAALRRGLELAASANAPLLAVRAWDLGLPRHGGRRRHHRRGRHLVLFMNPEVPRRQAAALASHALRVAGGSRPRLAVSVMTPQGEPGAVLARLATCNDVLVVGASAGHGLHHAVHGSVGAYCRRHARCTVVSVGHEQEVRHAG